MNIFLPYEHSLTASVSNLDDLRLNKQCLETYQLLSNAIKEMNGEEIKGYKNHPIYVHYKRYWQFLYLYGTYCCYEYKYRFGKEHKLLFEFENIVYGLPKRDYVEFTPFYMEGSKGQPNYIRTTENVSELYQQKLCKKWDNDKSNGRPPKWTNRGTPSFYKEKQNAKTND